MAIEFPGYEPVFPNEVFAKDASVIEDGKVTPVKMILMPARYAEPDEDSVVKYLQAKAEAAAERLSLTVPGQRIEAQSPLEMMLLKAGRSGGSLLTHLRAGHKQCLAFVRELTLAPKLEQGEVPNQYLQIRYGMIPVQKIENYRDAGKINNAGWYDWALSDPLGTGIALLLCEAKLPNRLKVYEYIAEGHHGTKLAGFSRKRYSPEEARLVLEAVYEALAKPEQIEQVKDISAVMLDSVAERTLNRMLS